MKSNYFANTKRNHRTLDDRPDGGSPAKKQQIKLKNVLPNKKAKYPREFERKTDDDTRKVKIRRDADGNKTVNQYVLLKKIGRGAYAKVKLCLNTEDNQYYAMKVLKKSVLTKRRVGMKKGIAFEDVMREIQIMKRMSHKNIIQLYEVINDPNDDHLFMALEHAEHGSILKGEPEDFVAISEEKAKKYFCDILAGIEYIHSLKIIHRDIKPENLLVTADGSAKLSDFGISVLMVQEDDEVFKRTAGSPAFLAPEVCSETAKVIGTALDVWGLGVSLYCMIFAKLPFTGDTESQLYDNIRDREPSLSQTSPELEDLFKKILNKDPEKRITIAELKNHPWVLGTKLTASTDRSRTPSQDSASSSKSL